MAAEKECSTCGQTKPLDEFGRSRNRRDGRDARCKECRARLKRERYANDPQFREAQKEYQRRPEVRERRNERERERRSKAAGQEE